MSAEVNKTGSEAWRSVQPHPLFRLNLAVGEQASRYAVTGDGNADSRCWCRARTVRLIIASCRTGPRG